MNGHARVNLDQDTQNLIDSPRSDTNVTMSATVIHNVSDWLSREDRLDTGYKLQVHRVVELPASAPLVGILNKRVEGEEWGALFFAKLAGVSEAKDSGRYKVANCTQAQPVFYGFAGLPDGKVILVSVLSHRARS